MFWCPSCELQFDNEHQLLYHSLQTHDVVCIEILPLGGMRVFNITTNVVRYYCTECNANYRHQNRLARHFRSHGSAFLRCVIETTQSAYGN